MPPPAAAPPTAVLAASPGEVAPVPLSRHLHPLRAVVEGRRQLHGNRRTDVTVPCLEPAKMRRTHSIMHNPYTLPMRNHTPKNIGSPSFGNWLLPKINPKTFTNIRLFGKSYPLSFNFSKGSNAQNVPRTPKTQQPSDEKKQYQPGPQHHQSAVTPK